MEGIYDWDRNRLSHLIRKGYVVTWREKEMRTQAKLYTLSVGAKRICSSVYKKLLQEEHIPENKRNNPIYRGDSYMDKVYRKAIERMNMAREARLRKEREDNV